MASGRYAKTILTPSEELYLLIDWCDTRYDIIVSDGRDFWEKHDVPCNAPLAFKHGDEQWRARVHEALCCPAKACGVSFQFQANRVAAKRTMELSWSWQESSNVRGKSLATVTLPPAGDSTATLRTMLRTLCTSNNEFKGALDGFQKECSSLRDKLEACQEQLASFEEQKRKWEEDLVWQVAELLNKHNARIAELEEELARAEEERMNLQLQHEAGTDEEEDEEVGTSSHLDQDHKAAAGSSMQTGQHGDAAAMDVDIKEEEGDEGAVGAAAPVAPTGHVRAAPAAPTDPSWLDAPELMEAATQQLPPYVMPESAAGPSGVGAAPSPSVPRPAAARQQMATSGGASQQAAAPPASQSAAAALQGPATIKVRRRPGI